MNGYLIPANAKKGTLIFSIFRPIDLGIFATGVGISLLLLAFLPSNNIIVTVIAIMPALICGLLVLPVPNYHNVLCALNSIYKFYTERRNYIWKGWCFYEQFKDEQTSRK